MPITPDVREQPEHFDSKEQAAILVCADLFEENKRDLAYVNAVEGEIVRSVVTRHRNRFDLVGDEFGKMVMKLKEWKFVSLEPINRQWVFKIEIKAVDYKRRVQSKRKLKNRILVIGSAIGGAVAVLTGIVKFWEEIRKVF